MNTYETYLMRIFKYKLNPIKMSLLNRRIVCFNFFLSLLFLFSFTIKIFSQASAITVWKEDAIGAIWNEASKTVAYGKKDANGKYKIFLSDSAGNNEQQLTFAGWDPDRHQWAEEWYPSGEYLFCYIEKTDYVSESGHTRISDDAIPGYGGYTDLWAIKRDGSQAWQLTNLENNYDNGLIHGAISRDGTLFAWSQRIQAPALFDMNLAAGAYVMKVADLSIDPVPTLSNIRTYQPGNLLAANELEGISNDHTFLSFYSTFESKNLFATPIYTLNMVTGEMGKLTTESFAQAPTFTPSGDKIVYMSGKDCDIFTGEIQGADWWYMNTNGSNKLRVTRMNVANDPQSVNHYRLAGSISFISDSSFFGGVMSQPLGLTGYTVKVRILPGIGEEQEPELFLFPNPTTGIVSVHLYNIKEEEEIQIHNVLGNLLFNKSISEVSQIDITNFPSGIYLLSMKRKPKVSMKLIKR
jgi:hypothetical protein